MAIGSIGAAVMWDAGAGVVLARCDRGDLPGGVDRRAAAPALAAAGVVGARAVSSIRTYPGPVLARLTGMSDTSTDPKIWELTATVNQSWKRFLEVYEPLRPVLYRFCRYLSRSPWDAEDLVQDTLARAFATLGGMTEPPRDRRAWLFRVASNLWIDQVRRRAVRSSSAAAAGDDAEHAAAATSTSSRDTREAAGTLLVQLSPQERAAVVLKDAFDLGLDEIAEILSTSVGAVKAALHRGRGKLAEPDPELTRTPAPAFSTRSAPRSTRAISTG